MVARTSPRRPIFPEQFLSQYRAVPMGEASEQPTRLPVQRMYTLDHEIPQQAAPVDPAAPSADDLAVLDQMLITLVESGGAARPLPRGSPPMIGVDGSLRPLPGYGKLNSADTALLARAAVTPQ